MSVFPFFRQREGLSTVPVTVEHDGQVSVLTEYIFQWGESKSTSKQMNKQSCAEREKNEAFNHSDVTEWREVAASEDGERCPPPGTDIKTGRAGTQLVGEE